MARIILTADRTLVANYDVLLEGMLGSVGTSFVPEPAYRALMSPKAPRSADGQVRNPPYGLRKLEAALVANGFDRPEIAFAAPGELSRFFGGDEGCKIIAISSGDPLGEGMSSTTMTGIMGGSPYNKIFFEKAVAEANGLKKKNPALKICCGGAGMWQFLRNPGMISKLGMDHVFIGYGDKTVPGAFRDIIAGKSLPQIIECQDPKISDIKEILGPSSMGIVEIGRWCGRGCGFCTMRDKPMLHIPREMILSEIRTNLKHGMPNIATLSEDFLRYGSSGINIDEKKVLALYESIAGLPGLRLVQPDHVNAASVCLAGADGLKDIHQAMALRKTNDWLWVNVGVETASAELLEKIAPAKARPFAIKDWPDLIRQTVEKLNQAGFFPFLSILFGAPGETREDIEITGKFLDDIGTMRAAAFPVFYVGITENDKSFYVDDMKPYHWKLFARAYEMNFKWVPKLFAANQKTGGVGFGKRLMTQVTGRMGILTTRQKIRKLARNSGHG